MPCCSICDWLLAQCCRPMATLAAICSINQIIVSKDSILKRRRWYAEWLRIPGNVLLRLRKAPVRVLSREVWIERESRIAGAIKVDGGLQMPRIAGVPLACFLAGEETPQKKQDAICIAMRALFELHQRSGQSHGDASATNVMITEDHQGLSAMWFDFDVAHVDATASALNRADDLRALLVTSASLPPHASLKSAYPGEHVWELAMELLSQGPLDIFHLAQRARIKRSKRG